MAALARLLLILFVALTVVYVSLSLYSRSVRRDKLEDEWDEEMDRQDHDDQITGPRDTALQAIAEADREAFVRAGLEDYDHSLRRKLILGVYIVPIALIGTIIYFVNYN